MIGLASLGQSLKSRYFSSFEYPEYRKLWLATLCSQSAAWALIVARAAFILDLTGSSTWTGAVIFAAMIPSVLVSPLAGYLADRFDRRTVLACAYAVNVVDNLILAILVATGVAQPWQVLVLSAVTGSARSTQMPAAQALLANMVSREGILNAVSLYQATVQGSRFSGPFLILVVIWATGHQNWVFFLCAAMYVLGLFAVLSIRTVSRGVVQAGRFGEIFLSNLMAGLSYMYHHPLIVSLILLVVAHCGMTMSFESLFPVLVLDKLDAGDGAGIMAGFSNLMVGYGLAALVTALSLAGVRSQAARGRLLLWLGIFSGIAPVVLAMAPNMPLAIAAAAGMGASQGGFMTLSHAMIQTIAPDAIRGRLLGVYNWHTNGFMASFNLVNGVLAGLGALNAPIILAASGIGFVVVVILSFARVPLRQLYARGVPAT
ncbi:MAG: MFS transporter [Chloroflexi bacterium]|nr:MFS transporter [Chloroflexota bacterium]